MWVFCELGDNKAATRVSVLWVRGRGDAAAFVSKGCFNCSYIQPHMAEQHFVFPLLKFTTWSGYLLIEQLIVMEISLWFRLCLAASTDWLKYTLMLALKLICGFTKKNIVTEPPVICHPALVSKGSEVRKCTLVFRLIPAVFIYSKKHFIYNHWHQYRWWKPSLKGHYGPANVESIKSCMIIRWLSMAHLHTLCQSWAGEHYFSFP